MEVEIWQSVFGDRTAQRMFPSAAEREEERMICARTKKTTSCSKQAGVVAGASQTTRKKICGAKGETDADVAIGKSCK
jgi:hypothetical protein